MEIMHQKRISYWDNIKGLMIILVVFAHFLLSLPVRSSLLNNIIYFIYMFHIPVFVFVSGFFGKSINSRSLQSLGKLLFLYFIFNSFAGFFYGFDSLLIPKYSYWYLLALVVWRTLTPYIAAYKNIQIFLLGIALLAGFFPSIDNTLSLARIICFYPYYMAGYLLGDTKANYLCKQKYFVRLRRGLAVLAFAVISAGVFQYVFSYTENSLEMFAYADICTDAIARIGLYIVAFSVIFALRCLTPKRYVALLTLFGRNSLWIFLFHRPVTLLIAPLFNNQPDSVIVLISLLLTLFLCFIFGNTAVANFMDKFALDGVNLFRQESKTRFNTAKFMSLCVLGGFLFLILQGAYSGLTWKEIKKTFFLENNNSVLMPASLPRVMPLWQQEVFDNAFRITFAGDLILLEDQVKRGYRSGKYDFTDVFEYAGPYISSADFAIGVFEGPTAGEEAGYSSGNFDDGKELFLNFPDEFAKAVKQAGFDLLTTANNHLFDKGVAGILRTIDVLDKTGLEHTGSYRDINDKENNHIKLVEKDGIKMAILSYTYGSNYMDSKQLFEGNLSYLTSVISGTEGELFEKMKSSVEEDFKKAKELKPDLIIVLPHLGTQFSNQPDAVQEKWFGIFKDNGADIILGDHPHVVEPVVLENINGKTVLSAYCPGNFANIYRKNQGDTSMLVDVYIDRSSKKVIGASIVPLYTQSPADGNYRALPVFEMLYNKSLRKQLSTDDLKFAAYAHNIITKVLFGHSWDISGAVAPRYYMDENGFLSTKQRGMELTKDMRASKFLKVLNKAETVCFIGDSITEGTKNEGHPWYEPLEPFLSAQSVLNYSRGGATVGDILKQADEIPAAEVYVIAIGTNDVRYRNPDKCAMTPQDFVNKTDMLKQKLKEKSPDATFVFIAPWYSSGGDPFSALGTEDKKIQNGLYSSALEQYCKNNGILYINPNGYIYRELQKHPQQYYLLDHIHPNAAQGIILYSQAVLLSAA